MSDLLASLDRDPENLQTWLIYADLLNERGDPRGELITLDCALHSASDTERASLEVRRFELYELHGPALLGPIGSKAIEAGFLEIVWQRGFVTELRYVGRRTWSHRRAVGWLVDVLADEPYRFLRKLDLSYTDIDDVSRLPTRHLTELILRGTRVADVRALERFTALKHINVASTGISKADADAFRATLRSGVG